MAPQVRDGLTERWEESLEEHRRLSPGSPVAVLDALLRERPGAPGGGRIS
ncbi:hypothetical protein LO771_08275 [Streptacidiphilus sp. ASG 303]|nr:hypothetical protein [Streptacidiphilus sp. ASG 303]MCD0482399.1 hypothetical protein [Streptacidiphilus sp. ASG 303]